MAEERTYEVVQRELDEKKTSRDASAEMLKRIRPEEPSEALQAKKALQDKKDRRGAVILRLEELSTQETAVKKDWYVFESRREKALSTIEGERKMLKDLEEKLSNEINPIEGQLRSLDDKIAMLTEEIALLEEELSNLHPAAERSVQKKELEDVNLEATTPSPKKPSISKLLVGLGVFVAVIAAAATITAGVASLGYFSDLADLIGKTALTVIEAVGTPVAVLTLLALAYKSKANKSPEFSPAPVNVGAVVARDHSKPASHGAGVVYDPTPSAAPSAKNSCQP